MNLRGALARALASIDLRERVRERGRTLAQAIDGRKPTRVLAVGKAATAMIEGALDAAGDSIEVALVVLPDAAQGPRADPRIRVMRASHPLPDARSVAAGEAALAFEADLALVSGGTSSLVFVPLDTLERARAAIAALLASGADVRAINTVRRHASRVHGGRLDAAATLLASDVLEGAPHDIGSGPTVADPTTLADARDVLAAHAPAHAGLAMSESSKGKPASDRVAIIAEPEALAAAFAAALSEQGLVARVRSSVMDNVLVCARMAQDLARDALPPGHALVWSAEPSLRIDGTTPGAGGRCTHLAALVARALPPGVTFLAAASDGVDGGSGTAGAIVDAGSFPDRDALDGAIAAFDTGPLHLARGTALPWGPTGLNLADLHALVRAK